MILIFRLAVPISFRSDDLGIVKAVRNAYGLRKTPDARRLLKIGEPGVPIARWRPGTCGPASTTEVQERDD